MKWEAVPSISFARNITRAAAHACESAAYFRGADGVNHPVTLEIRQRIDGELSKFGFGPTSTCTNRELYNLLRLHLEIALDELKKAGACGEFART